MITVCTYEVSLTTKLRRAKTTRSIRLSLVRLLKSTGVHRVPTSVIQLRQGPNLRISAHDVFTVTKEHEGKATQLTNLVSRQRCGTHICGIRRAVHLLECQSLVRDRFLEPQSPQTHMFRRNTVAATTRVIHDDLTVRSNDDNTTGPEDPQLTLNSQRARALRDCSKQLILPNSRA